MDDEIERNPDGDFVLCGKKETIRTRDDDYLTNSQRTISTKNLTNTSKITTGSKQKVPDIADLERSINELKMDLYDLNHSLRENYGKSKVFLAEDAKRKSGENTLISNDEDPELTHMMQRRDHEAVSHSASLNPEWFSDPKHKTKPLGEYPTMQEMGASRRTVLSLGRSVGRFGSEIATKNVDDGVRPIDVASNDKTFPVRLSAPHIVGVRSLLPPKHTVRSQNRERTKSIRARSRSVEPELTRSLSARMLIRESRSRSRNRTRTRERTPSPRPVWMPTSSRANAIAQPPPSFRKKQRGRSASKPRPGSAPSFRKMDLSKSLPTQAFRTRPTRYVRPHVQPQPSEVELSFLRSADQIDTRRALVENSPYQQELSRLRLERLRVEEDYLLQLKRESELERIRGPKPKWYEMKGPEFHYECNKNTTLHKNSDQWGETLQYRDDLLETSREFAANMRSPVPALE